MSVCVSVRVCVFVHMLQNEDQHECFTCKVRTFWGPEDILAGPDEGQVKVRGLVNVLTQ